MGIRDFDILTVVSYSQSKSQSSYSVTAFYFILFFWPRSMRDLSSPTRDPTRAPCSGSRAS